MNSSSDRPLRLALLGSDKNTAAMLHAVHVDSRFQLAGICELSAANEAEVRNPLAAFGRVRRIGSWESLLDQEQIDAVVVAAGASEEVRADQLRKLIQAGVPVLASHPLFDSMLVYYELDMIRRETNCVALPLLFQRDHPAVRALAEIVSQGERSPIGRVEQVIIARGVEQGDKQMVTAQFARDVDLLRVLAGDLTRLGAMTGGQGRAAYSSLGVQMSGPGGLAARWSAVPGQSSDRAEVTLLASGGKARLEMRASDQAWNLETSVDGRPSVRQFEPWNPAAAALDGLARVIAGTAVQPDWVDGSRSVELAETIQRSLTKQRSIELYYEDYTEEGTFKGTMASLGCGLLLLGLGVLGAVGLIDAVSQQKEATFVRAWPYLLVGVLGVFLLLQFLVFAAGKREPTSIADVPAKPPAMP